jgi:Flp pilus assembly protein TadB
MSYSEHERRLSPHADLSPDRRSSTHRRQRARAFIGVDLAIGILIAVVAVLVAPGIAIVGMVAIVVLLLAALSLLFERRRARRRRRRAAR